MDEDSLKAKWSKKREGDVVYLHKSLERLSECKFLRYTDKEYIEWLDNARYMIFLAFDSSDMSACTFTIRVNGTLHCSWFSVADLVEIDAPNIWGN